MFRWLKRRKNALFASWPPGLDERVIGAGPQGLVFQLRPGAAMTHASYVALMHDILMRHADAWSLN